MVRKLTQNEITQERFQNLNRKVYLAKRRSRLHRRAKLEEIINNVRNWMSLVQDRDHG